MPVDRPPRRDPFAPEQQLDLRLQAKRELRKRMLGVRARLPRDQRTSGSAAVTERVLAHPSFARARSIALFKSILEKGEIDTSALDAAARARGMRVAYPMMEGELYAPPGECSMSFRFVDDLSRFAERGRGFEEPPEDAAVAEELDLIVVPALALDEQGFRLGYGAGLYDRTLVRFASAHTIGIAYDFQLIVEVPRTEGDVPVKTIVTDKRTIEVSS